MHTGVDDVPVYTMSSENVQKTSSIRIKNIKARDLDTVFSMLLLSIPFNDAPYKRKRRRTGIVSGIFFKQHPYTFTVGHALKQMENLELSITNGNGITTISCGIKPQSARSFLGKFLDAKLIHFPGDRTRNKVTSSNPDLVLQPTAKGIYFLQRYCHRNGVYTEEVERLLLSSFNTMKCIALDRHVVSDKIVQSDIFIHLLFKRFMGPYPNTYNANAPAEEVPLLSVEDNYCHYESSPYAHRYFTHPDSDSLTQYYTSSRGVRLFKNRVVDIDYCVSGKAIIQWLLDCTDIIYPEEALEIGNLFIHHNLLVPIANNVTRLTPSKDVLYVFSKKARELGDWKERTLPPVSSSMLSLKYDISMKDVLDDAGFRLLFREHLAKEFCEENLLFYTELQNFTTKYTSSQLSELKALTYFIYNQFLTPGAPSELNIDHRLKNKLVSLLIQEDIDLEKVKVLFEETKSHVFKMMQQDSFPKFVSSREFLTTMSSIRRQ